MDSATDARETSSPATNLFGTEQRAADTGALNVGASLRSSRLSIGVAESLTGGLLASTFAAMEGASEFFRGSVVAYAGEVKFRLLGVTPGPVVNQRTADEMAEGAKRLFQTDIAVGVTGVGGPESEEDHPPGNVFVSISCLDDPPIREEFQFSGDPEAVCRSTCRACLDLVGRALARLAK